MAEICSCSCLCFWLLGNKRKKSIWLWKNCSESFLCRERDLSITSCGFDGLNMLKWFSLMEELKDGNEFLTWGIYTSLMMSFLTQQHVATRTPHCHGEPKCGGGNDMKAFGIFLSSSLCYLLVHSDTRYSKSQATIFFYYVPYFFLGNVENTQKGFSFFGMKHRLHGRSELHLS